MASPFRFDVTDVEKDLLIPAVNGTKVILESIKLYTAEIVEYVVIISSMAALLDISKLDYGNAGFSEKSRNLDTWESCQRNALFDCFRS